MTLEQIRLKMELMIATNTASSNRVYSGSDFIILINEFNDNVNASEAVDKRLDEQCAPKKPEMIKAPHPVGCQCPVCNIIHKQTAEEYFKGT